MCSFCNRVCIFRLLELSPLKMLFGSVAFQKNGTSNFDELAFEKNKKLQVNSWGKLLMGICQERKKKTKLYVLSTLNTDLIFCHVLG